MSAPQQRPFTTIDGLIILAALALGAAWVTEARRWVEVLANRNRFVPRDLFHLAAAFVAPLTLALLIVRVRRPRPSLALCLRQPGTVGCAVAAIVLILEVGNHFLDLTARFYDKLMLVNWAGYSNTSGRLPGLNLFDAIAFSVGEAPGLAVAGAYLALWSAGLWRADSSWIERAGRALGWFWIVEGVALIVLPPWRP
jgi:hypothetical protein